MLVLPAQAFDANVQALAQRYSETLTGNTGSTLDLSYTPATTQDNVTLAQVYRNGVLIGEGSSGGGGTIVRERRALTGSVVSLTSTGSGVATATTGAAHTLVSGNIVDVSGATQGAYDVTATITFDSSTGFDYPIVGSPTSPATGTIKWAAQSFDFLQTPTSGPELLFINGTLRDPNTYTRTGSRIDLGGPLTAGSIVVLWYQANGGGYTVAGKTLTFDTALTATDVIVVHYQYRN